MKKLIQNNPPHPGKVLCEYYLKPLGMNITEASVRFLITRPNLSSIVNQKSGISAVMALKLAKAFKTTPQYWMNLQGNYDLWQATKTTEEVLKKVQEPTRKQ
ncbi:MAG TPA: HigA family addiction module antitoxin [Chryseosolibacter sp.]